MQGHSVLKSFAPLVPVIIAIFSLSEIGQAEFQVQELYTLAAALEKANPVNETRIPGVTTDELLERSLEPRACYAPNTQCRCKLTAMPKRPREARSYIVRLQ
ncbi:hypothetical protein BJY01DRAFT_218783 [Aspergillus pseudoustus]|uniref:Uncharacterized protein n=1 Tax=Aspergillus pseudoustus TaxID=1810923 RepID=A0ABR4JJ50_9EURO